MRSFSLRLLPNQEINHLWSTFRPLPCVCKDIPPIPKSMINIKRDTSHTFRHQNSTTWPHWRNKARLQHLALPSSSREEVHEICKVSKLSYPCRRQTFRNSSLIDLFSCFLKWLWKALNSCVRTNFVVLLSRTRKGRWKSRSYRKLLWLCVQVYAHSLVASDPPVDHTPRREFLKYDSS